MTGKKVLVVPLNWGLGHASRVIPLISALQKAGSQVIIGGSPAHIALLKEEFKEIEVISLPYLKIHINGKKSQILQLILQIPSLIKYLIKEHRSLKRQLKLQNIDLIISDNCYALWNTSVRSIFITHQLKIKLPAGIKFLESAVNKINHRFIGKFDECWVPDLKDIGIAGELSQSPNNNKKIRYIGILSRFNLYPPTVNNIDKKESKNLLIILSGPENQRTQFENKLKKELEALDKSISYLVIRGLPEQQDTGLPAGWYNHLPSKQMREFILNADFIICRSGYSTIMDLVALSRTALLVPTPGQTEQEYLADYLSFCGYFLSQTQQNFNMEKGLKDLEACREKNENRIKLLLNHHSELDVLVKETLNGSG